MKELKCDPCAIREALRRLRYEHSHINGAPKGNASRSGRSGLVLGRERRSASPYLSHGQLARGNVARHP